MWHMRYGRIFLIVIIIIIFTLVKQDDYLPYLLTERSLLALCTWNLHSFGAITRNSSDYIARQSSSAQIRNGESEEIERPSTKWDSEWESRIWLNFGMLSLIRFRPCFGRHSAGFRRCRLNLHCPKSYRNPACWRPNFGSIRSVFGDLSA